jgi:hypothetical protein
MTQSPKVPYLVPIMCKLLEAYAWVDATRGQMAADQGLAPW